MKSPYVDLIDLYASGRNLLINPLSRRENGTLAALRLKQDGWLTAVRTPPYSAVEELLAACQTAKEELTWAQHGRIHTLSILTAAIARAIPTPAEATP